MVYARYTRGIRDSFLVYAWYTRGMRVVAWYAHGIRVVYAGIRWYTTLMAPQPQNGENRQWWSFQSEVKDLPKLLGTWLRTDAARL